MESAGEEDYVYGGIDAARPIYSTVCEGIFSYGAFVLIYGKAVIPCAVFFHDA